MSADDTFFDAFKALMERCSKPFDTVPGMEGEDRRHLIVVHMVAYLLARVEGLDHDAASRAVDKLAGSVVTDLKEKITETVKEARQEAIERIEGLLRLCPTGTVRRAKLESIRDRLQAGETFDVAAAVFGSSS